MKEKHKESINEYTFPLFYIDTLNRNNKVISTQSRYTIGLCFSWERSDGIRFFYHAFAVVIICWWYELMSVGRDFLHIQQTAFCAIEVFLFVFCQGGYVTPYVICDQRPVFCKMQDCNTSEWIFNSSTAWSLILNSIFIPAFSKLSII